MKASNQFLCKHTVVPFVIAGVMLASGIHVHGNDGATSNDISPITQYELLGSPKEMLEIAVSRFSEEKKQYIEKELPHSATSQKAWMNYLTITSTGSRQFQMQQQAYTDEHGFRRYDDTYMVAMGTYYSKTCGKRLRIALDNGFEFDVIIGDIKSDSHTDYRNQHRSGNVIEFIVDEMKISKDCRRMGDMSYADGGFFDGKIVSIKEQVGE